MNPTKPRRMIGYIRVSRVGTRDVDSESYITESLQREKIEQWAKLRDIEVIWEHPSGITFIDRDQSGAKLSRPGFDTAMKMIKDGKADGIVVAQIDRLSRADVADALMIVRQIHDDYGGAVAAVDLGIDPTTEVGEMLLTVLLALARMQWRRYQAAWATSKERAIKRGVHVGWTPLGYRREADGRLSLDPVAAPIVRRAYEIAATKGLRAAVDHLQTSPLDRDWNTVSARRLLTHRIYLGEIKNDGLVNTAAHKPLIDLATWTAAARKSGAKLEDHRPGGKYALSHVARCAACGSGLIGHRGKDATIRAYRCPRNRTVAVRSGGAERCPAPTMVGASALEDFVRAALQRHVELNCPDAAGPSSAGSDQEAITRAELAMRSAELARDQDANDLRLREILGDEAFYERLHTHSAAVQETKVAYEQLALKANEVTSMPLVDEIEDAPADELPGLLERIGLVVSVSRGRGKLVERVRLAPGEPIERRGRGRPKGRARPGRVAERVQLVARG